MKMEFNVLLSKLNSHFNEEPDGDIIFVSATDGAPHSYITTSSVKTEPHVVVPVLTYDSDTVARSPEVSDTVARSPEVSGQTFEELLADSDIRVKSVKVE